MAKINANESSSMSNCTFTEKGAEQRFLLCRSEQSSSPSLQSHHILQAISIFQRKEKDQRSNLRPQQFIGKLMYFQSFPGWQCLQDQS